MEERREMAFGKKYRFGNFECYKVTHALGKKEVLMLRDAAGIPKDMRKHLNRASLPYIVVRSISGDWHISFVCGSSMYRFIEFEVMNGEEGEQVLYNLFTMMYSDTSVLGDDVYYKAKAAALKSFMLRIRTKDVSQEDDDKELESMRVEEEAKAAIIEMGKEIENGMQ